MAVREVLLNSIIMCFNRLEEQVIIIELHYNWIKKKKFYLKNNHHNDLFVIGTMND